MQVPQINSLIQNDIFNVKVKVKLSLCLTWAQRYKGVLENGGVAPRILELGSR